MNAIPRSIDDRLRALEAKRQTWEAGSATQDENSINWNDPISVPRWLPRRYVARTLSQFLHGERVTAEICRKGLADWHQHPMLRACIEGQIKDEERHAGLFRRYLQGIGDIAPMEPALAVAMESAAAWHGPPEARLVAINILLEGQVLRMLESLGNILPCPLFSQINRHVARDEARHVAMGKIVLSHRLATLERGDRLAIYRWIAGLWRDCADGMLAGVSVPGVITAGRRRRWLDAGWTQQVRSMIDIGLIDEQDIRECAA